MKIVGISRSKTRRGEKIAFKTDPPVTPEMIGMFQEIIDLVNRNQEEYRLELDTGFLVMSDHNHGINKAIMKIFRFMDKQGGETLMNPPELEQVRSNEMEEGDTQSDSVNESDEEWLRHLAVVYETIIVG